MKDLTGKKDKHDHKLTNILKFVIFAIVMLAPFIAILSKIVYVSANKNAKDSYYGETINESKEVNLENKQIMTNTTYHFYANQNTTNNINGTFFNLSMIKINYIFNENQTNALKQNTEEITNIYFFVNSDIQYMQFRKADTTLVGSNVPVATSLIDFEYQYVSTSNTNLYTFLQLNSYQTEYNKYSYLDDVFYYAIDQSKDEEILKWTKDTPIYTAINAMNTGLGLSSNHILTYLLTYWSIMIAIYIIFDIVIFALTKLTHWLQ